MDKCLFALSTEIFVTESVKAEMQRHVKDHMDAVLKKNTYYFSRFAAERQASPPRCGAA